MFLTEYEFELPKGFIDNDGNLHKKGVMRLATAMDEILPLKDSRVLQNEAYISIILLARVIVKLGTLTHIDTMVIERLFSADLNYLQDFYQRINSPGDAKYSFECPHCANEVNIPAGFFTQKQ